MTLTRDWLDGPRLYSWLREHGLESMEIQLGFHARTVRHWREGAVASVYTADTVLCKLGLHLSELPDELWVDAPKGTVESKAKITPEKRREIARRVVELEQPVKAVARELGCDPKTVRKYAGAAA